MVNKARIYEAEGCTLYSQPFLLKTIIDADLLCGGPAALYSRLKGSPGQHLLPSLTAQGQRGRQRAGEGEYVDDLSIPVAYRWPGAVVMAILPLAPLF